MHAILQAPMYPCRFSKLSVPLSPRDASCQVGPALFLLLAASCRAPTEVTLQITTDVPCTESPTAAVAVGDTPERTETRSPSAVTTACNSETGRIGALVLVPSGNNGDAF